MTTTYTKVNKPTGTAYTKITNPSSAVTTLGSPIGLLLALTYPKTAGTTYAKVSKAIGTIYTKITKAT